MYVKFVAVSNFRGILKAQTEFQPGLNIIIGPNNVGKSNLLTAIDLVLNPYLQWWRRDLLTNLDFYRSETNSPIEIEVVIGCERSSCIDGEDICPRLELQHGLKTEPCRFAEQTLIWDKAQQKYLRHDDIDNAQSVETVIRLKMIGEYQQPEGYVEVKHTVLNENEQEWARLSRPMKEWLGARLLGSDRDPLSECKLRYNSLLSKAIGNIDIWRTSLADVFRKSLTPIVQKLASETATATVTKIVDEATKHVGLRRGEETTVSVVGAKDYDVIRQVELSRKGSETCGSDTIEWEVPFARQGRGIQNIATIVLGLRAQLSSTSGAIPVSIMMLEEPEQNLEPQLQRSVVSTIKSHCSRDAQLMLSTHSPYVLSPLLGLEGVHRLSMNHEGVLDCRHLGSVCTGRWDFYKLRINGPVDNDMELLEALFSPIVVIWEGGSEAGFYPQLMRLHDSYPSEWLAGLNAGGATMALHYGQWFTSAGYKVCVVLDGDKSDPLDELFALHIPFIALPHGKNLEHIVAESVGELSQRCDSDAANALVSALGTEGFIGWHEEYRSMWPSLVAVFEEADKPNKLLTTDILDKLPDAARRIQGNQSPDNIRTVLGWCKGRRGYRTLADSLHEHDAVPEACNVVIDKLEDIWRGQEARYYQLKDDCTLEEYTN